MPLLYSVCNLDNCHICLRMSVAACTYVIKFNNNNYCTVKPLYSEQSRDPKKCSLYRGVHPRGVRYVHVHMCLQYTKNGSVLASKGLIRW